MPTRRTRGTGCLGLSRRSFLAVSAVAGGALVMAAFGFYWDVATHIDNGRDPGPFPGAKETPRRVNDAEGVRGGQPPAGRGPAESHRLPGDNRVGLGGGFGAHGVLLAPGHREVAEDQRSVRLESNGPGRVYIAATTCTIRVSTAP